MSLSRLIPSLSKGARQGLLASVIFPASLVPGQGGLPSSDHHVLTALPLPSGATIRSSDTFGTGSHGRYYFLEKGDRLRLFRLELKHPMGAQDLWMESWRLIRVPALAGQERLRTATVGMQHLFLAGEESGGTPFIRSYQIGQKTLDGRTTPTLTGRVDYFPDSDTTPVRRLYFDSKSRILWLGYDSGRVESGRPYLVLHDRILWSDPSGYLPLPDETLLSRGPSPLLTPRSLSKVSSSCFSCRYYLVSRTEPEGLKSRPGLPVRSPEQLDSALGILPMGSGKGLFMGRQAFVCGVPEPGRHARLKGCEKVALEDLPVGASWWGNRLAYLYPPGRFSWNRSRWSVVAINPAMIDNAYLKRQPGKDFALRQLLSSAGHHYLLPPGARPRPQTFFTDGRRLVLFGRSHLYLLDTQVKSMSGPTKGSGE